MTVSSGRVLMCIWLRAGGGRLTTVSDASRTGCGVLATVSAAHEPRATAANQDLLGFIVSSLQLQRRARRHPVRCDLQRATETASTRSRAHQQAEVTRRLAPGSSPAVSRRDR